MRALFVYDIADLAADVPGGVQLCTREFLTLVRAAATETHTLSITGSRKSALRVRRKLKFGAYLGYDARALKPALAASLTDFRPSHVFLNRSELIRLAPVVKQLSPSTHVVVMSHGNQSGDDLYELAGPAGRKAHGLTRLGAMWKLGQDLATEAWHRHRFVDTVAVMSPEEAVLERWLGARRTVILPRLISPAPLAWQPAIGRCGYVGTLDHTPNRVALESVCAALQSQPASPLELRLVGGPAEAGEAIARRFRFVTYLGRLDDDALRTEAARWSVFLNPILWLSRGASMKLGVALGWGVPVLTTTLGARGYEWSDGNVPTSADAAADFAGELTHLLRDSSRLQAARDGCQRAAASAPQVAELAERLRRAVA